MSSFKKHFQNFSLQKQPNQEDLLHVSMDHQQRRSSQDVERASGSMKSNNYRHPTSLDCSMKDVSVDVLSFKSDIFNCLDMCTAYIQALNTLCSTGAVLAQNLTQVFSRDVNVDGDNIVSKSSNNQSRNSNGRRRFLGLKGARGQGEGTRLPSSGLDDDLDSNYYEVAEQFLQVWEKMSVSTAGASATIKTETLMTLQDILNNLEQESRSSDLRSKGDLGNNLSLEKSIRAAKTCLLAYIELQAQFSYNSWKSLNHLSTVLKSDPSMADVMGNVRKHFSPKNSGINPPNGSTSFETINSVDHQKKEKKQAKIDSNTIDGAINLLSMDNAGSKKERKKHRKGSRFKDSEKVSSLCSAKTQFPGKRSQFNREGVSTPQVACGQDNSAIIIKQSTWPGKEAMASMKSNEFARNITSDDWSMWPKSNNSDLQARSNDLFEGVKRDNSFLLPWNSFSNSTSSSSDSTINGGSAQLTVLDPTLNMTSKSSHFEPFVRRDPFPESNPRTTFSGPLENLLDDRTNLSVIELAKKLSLSSEGVYDTHTGYTFATDPFAAPSDSPAQLQSLDLSRSSKLSTWPMKQTNNSSLNGNNDWTTFDTQLAFDSSNTTASLFGSDPLSANYQGSSSLWPFDNREKIQASKVPTPSFNNIFLNEANNNGHLNHNFS